MPKNKTKATSASVPGFIDKIENVGRQADARALVELMQSATGLEPVLWVGSMIGFGRYDYKYDSGHEGTWFLTGFAPRKANMVVYIMPGFATFDKQLAKLGKFKTGKSCLYLGRLSGVDLDVLSDIVVRSVEIMKKRYAA